MMTWTEEKNAELRTMLENKVSFRKLAAHFGVSRSAIAGKAHRLGLSSSLRSVSPWTDERIEQLRALVSNKATLSEATRALGIKRNSVFRKAKQLSLVFRKGEFRTPSPNKRRAPRSRAERIVYLREVSMNAEPMLPLDMTPLTAISLFDLDDSTCRWPFGDRDFKFCGRREASLSAGHPYCPGHELQSINQPFLCEAAE